MGTMNKQLKLPQIQKIMMDFEKQVQYILWNKYMINYLSIPNTTTVDINVVCCIGRVEIQIEI